MYSSWSAEKGDNKRRDNKEQFFAKFFFVVPLEDLQGYEYDRRVVSQRSRAG